MAGEFSDALSKMGQNWDRVKGGGNLVKDGTYVATLQDSKLMISKSSEKLMVKNDYVITEGEFESEVLTQFISIENEFGARQLSQFIRVLGHEVPDDATDLEELIDTISNEAPSVSIKVASQKDSEFINIQILRILGEGHIPEGEVVEDEKEEEKPARS